MLYHLPEENDTYINVNGAGACQSWSPFVFKPCLLTNVYNIYLFALFAFWFLCFLQSRGFIRLIFK